MHRPLLEPMEVALITLAGVFFVTFFVWWEPLMW